MLTWVHDCLRPQVLHWVATPLPPLIVVDRTAAVELAVVLWLNLAVVDAVLKLQVLQHVLHLLLRGMSAGISTASKSGCRAYFIPGANIAGFDHGVGVMPNSGAAAGLTRAWRRVCGRCIGRRRIRCWDLHAGQVG